jgi:hypothetical protein
MVLARSALASASVMVLPVAVAVVSPAVLGRSSIEGKISRYWRSRNENHDPDLEIRTKKNPHF